MTNVSPGLRSVGVTESYFYKKLSRGLISRARSRLTSSATQRLVRGSVLQVIEPLEANVNSKFNFKARSHCASDRLVLAL